MIQKARPLKRDQSGAFLSVDRTEALKQNWSIILKLKRMEKKERN